MDCGGGPLGCGWGGWWWDILGSVEVAAEGCRGCGYEEDVEEEEAGCSW